MKYSNIIRTCSLAFCVGAAVFSMAAAVREDGRGRVGDRGLAVRGEQPQSQKRAHRALPARQTEALDQAQAEGVGVTWSGQMQSPLSVKGKDLGARRPFSGGKGLRARKGASWRDNALAVMDNLSPLFGVADAEAEFEVKRVDEDKLGFRHVRLMQRHQGLRVVGGEVIVHFNADEEAYEVNGQYAPGIEVGVQPVVAAAGAAKVAVEDVQEMGYAEAVVAGAPELVVYALNGAEPRLAYELAVPCKAAGGRPACWRYWVDAQTGGVLLKYDDVKHIEAPNASGAPATITGTLLEGEGGATVSIQGWQQNGAFYLYNPTYQWLIYNASPSLALYPDASTYAHRMTSAWGGSDPMEVSAAYNIDKTLRYYRERHGRNSFDNNNALVRVNVHQADALDNAYWSMVTHQISIGDSSGIMRGGFAVLDVMAHEFAHAVTEHTAALIYAFEPGALTESFSDIFGTCVEFYAQPDGRASYPQTVAGTANWLMGEDIYLMSASEAIRDLRNPSRFGQPSAYLGTSWLYGDAVHNNSGPQNFFFYLLCEGGAGNNDGYPYNVTGIGIAKAEQIAYRVLTVYCTPGMDYESVREAWSSAASDLYPETAESVRKAWDAVMGMQPAPQILTGSPLPEGRVGNEYAQSFSAVSQSPVAQWYLAGGTLPPDLTFSTNGVLSGLCTAAGQFVFSVAVIARNGIAVTNAFTLLVRPPFEAPFSDGFEAEGALAGWSQQMVSGNTGWRMRSGGVLPNKPSGPVEGNKNAYLGRWSDSGVPIPAHTARLVSPMIRFNPGARAAQLRFYLYMEKWTSPTQNQDELRVYCKTSALAGWGTPVATYTTSISPWTLQVVNLPPPPPGGQDYFIAFEGSAIGGCGICLDSVWIGDPIPQLTILTPSILPVALVGTNYTDLITLESAGGWSTDPGEYTYAVISGTMPSGFGLTPDGVVTGCSSVVQSGTFVVQVTDSEGRTETKEMTLSVELPRAPVFEDGFEGQITDKWGAQETTSGIKWKIVARGGHNGTLPSHNAHSPSKFAWFYGLPGPKEVIKAKLISKPLDLSQAPNNTRLNFWHFMQQFDGKQDQLTVYYRTSATAPWVELAKYTENVTNWTHRVIRLQNLTSTYQIAFEGYALGGNGIAIDTVSITDDAAAPIINTLPTLLGGFTGFPYYTALSAIGGTPPYAWSVVSNALPPGLTMNTGGEISGTPITDGHYTFRIAVAGVDGKASTNLFTLRVLPPGDVPFTEKFPGPALPAGWTIERVQGNADWVIAKGTPATATIPSALPKAPPAGLASNACFWTSDSATTISRLVSPPINLSNIASNAVLTFQLCMINYYSSYDRLYVRYREKPTDGWTTVAEFPNPCLQWTPQTVALPTPSSTTYYIAFEGHSKGGYGICVADVVIMGDPVVSPFEVWQRQHFTAGELLDPNISGPNADPDGDGIPNLMEYAMGLDPRSPDVNTWVWGGLTNVAGHADVPAGQYLYLTYRRKNDVKGVKFNVIGTPSLMPPDRDWKPDNIYEFTPWTPGTEPHWSWVHNIHLVPATTAPTRFMRLMIELE